MDSKFHILQADRKGCKRLHEARFRGKGGVPVELHGGVAAVNGRVYFTTTAQTICIGKPDHKAAADKIPEPVKEDAAKKGSTPAHVQVVPAEVNGTALYRVRLGPVTNEAEADRLLNKVVGSGYPTARIVSE